MIDAAPKLSVLVLHGMRDLSAERSTNIRHLFAWERYSTDCNFVYHLADAPLTDVLRSAMFDAILIDPTFLCWRWARPRGAFDALKEKYSFLRGSGAVIVAMPQDDYDHAAVLDEWLTEMGVSILPTICWPQRNLLYPRTARSGALLISAFTGYIDDVDVDRYSRVRLPFADRPIDVGYRVRRLPANFGRYGRIKSEFGRLFAHAATHSGLRIDISDDPQDSILGDEWPKFLGRCRFGLGSESGSGVIDLRGEIGDAVREYLNKTPDASFDDTIAACVPETSQAVTFSMLSPRIFELALAGCCPVLIEGEYHGLIEAEKHYIPVKRDFSNLEEVIDRLTDLEGAEEIAIRFSEVILCNPDLRYSAWVPHLMGLIREKHSQTNRQSVDSWSFVEQKEKHHSALGNEYRREIAELQDRNRLLGNELMRAKLPSWKRFVLRLLQR